MVVRNICDPCVAEVAAIAAAQEAKFAQERRALTAAVQATELVDVPHAPLSGLVAAYAQEITTPLCFNCCSL